MKFVNDILNLWKKCVNDGMCQWWNESMMKWVNDEMCHEMSGMMRCRKQVFLIFSFKKLTIICHFYWIVNEKKILENSL
jgi:hypothetical protein